MISKRRSPPCRFHHLRTAELEESFLPRKVGPKRLARNSARLASLNARPRLQRALRLYIRIIRSELRDPLS